MKLLYLLTVSGTSDINRFGNTHNMGKWERVVYGQAFQVPPLSLAGFTGNREVSESSHQLSRVVKRGSLRQDLNPGLPNSRVQILSTTAHRAPAPASYL